MLGAWGFAMVQVSLGHTPQGLIYRNPDGHTGVSIPGADTPVSFACLLGGSFRFSLLVGLSLLGTCEFRWVRYTVLGLQVVPQPTQTRQLVLVGPQDPVTVRG
jgi:hypothetical protein